MKKIIRYPKPRITKDIHVNETSNMDNVCPFCGKEASFSDRSFSMSNKTTGNGLSEPYVFHTYTTETYTCGRCYAMWETDPYEENPFKSNGLYKLVDMIKMYAYDLLTIDDGRNR